MLAPQDPRGRALSFEEGLTRLAKGFVHFERGMTVGELRSWGVGECEWEWIVHEGRVLSFSWVSTQPFRLGVTCIESNAHAAACATPSLDRKNALTGSHMY